MFWFKAESLIAVVSLTAFQYIICFGSSAIYEIDIKNIDNFNTSYVLVQEKSNLCIESLENDFNTSYVLVQEVNT